MASGWPQQVLKTAGGLKDAPDESSVANDTIAKTGRERKRRHLNSIA